MGRAERAIVRAGGLWAQPLMPTVELVDGKVVVTVYGVNEP